MTAKCAAAENPATQFLDALLASNRGRAMAVVRDLVARTSLAAVYADVLQPAMYELGVRWELGRVSVAQEHFVTAATQQIMATLHAESYVERPAGRRMLAASVGGNHHSVGIRMVADVFELAGWTTMFVGADTPTDAILATLATDEFDVLAVSAALAEHVIELELLVRAVRASGNEIRILVGGRALAAASERWHELGADGYAATPAQAVALAEALVPPRIARRPLTLVAPDPEVRADEARTFAAISEINTELHDMARALVAKNAELERVNAQLNRVMGVIAHDLRNPLSVVAYYARFLREDLEATLGDEQRGFLDLIDSSSEFMRVLLDDLLDVARLREGKLTLARGDVDVVALVRDVSALNQHLAQRKSIGLHVHTDLARLVAPLDRAKMQQVLNNLVGNAIQYSHPETAIRVDLAQEAGSLSIAVRDQGIGIAADDLAKVFQPFGTSRSKGTAGEKSTGLGLTIAQAIVAAHGGMLEVDSVVGTGSVFTVRIPVATPD